MKYKRAASWFTRVAVLFLLICIGLLFTAAAFELKHAPTRNDNDDDGQVQLQQVTNYT
jgi:hypothetical protein